MIKGTNRKDKVETLKGLLNGSKSLTDLIGGQIKLAEYAACNEAPGALYDRQGQTYTDEDVKAREEQLKARGFLVWSETRTYNTKAELHGFFEA